MAADMHSAILPLTRNIMRHWSEKQPPVLTPLKVWKPKNPEVRFLNKREVSMTECAWRATNFPYNPLPEQVQTNVNLERWSRQIDYMKDKVGLQAGVNVMLKVLDNLTYGCNSQVVPPGTKPTISGNIFPDPELDIPRIGDALATEVKMGHMSGPFDPGFVREAKVNGLISVSKPDGSRRQVGNLSHPPGLSFNDNLDPDVLKIWKVYQTTTRQFADKVARAGQGSLMSCSDMTNAYKNLPVALHQRRLQVFQFCGKQFVDLCLIFGDKSSCMWYDRFHACIVNFFVHPEVPIPMSWVGRTVVDLSTVSRKGSESWTINFVKQIRLTLFTLKFYIAS